MFGEGIVASAREIRARLRKKADDERKKREDAVVAVGDAGLAALKAREDNNTALRAAFETALRTRDGERVAKLRTEFEAALTDDPAVLAAELAAGRAVLAAAEFKVTQVELAELTELRVEDLRAWTQAARHAEQGSAPSASQGSAPSDEPVRPVTGYAVVAEARRGQDETGAGPRDEVDAAAG